MLHLAGGHPWALDYLSCKVSIQMKHRLDLTFSLCSVDEPGVVELWCLFPILVSDQA